jgi:hypothetical protein
MITCWTTGIPFPFPLASLGPTQRPNQWVPGCLSLGVKGSERETDYSHIVLRFDSA